MKMKSKLLLITSLFFINSIIIAQNTNAGTEAGNAGTNNSAFGYYAGNVVTGDFNSFFGAYSGFSNVAGKDNVFIGFRTGYNNLSGEKNMFIGRQAGYQNTIGGYNVFSGYHAGYSNFSGGHNAFYGAKSGFWNNGSDNTFIGYEAGYSNSSGSRNIFLGTEAGVQNQTGINNVFIGYQSGWSNQAGSYNVFTGDDSGLANKGNGNIFTGRQAGYRNTTGNYNLYLGYKAGFSNLTGSNNIFLGYKAGESELGSNRLYIDNTGTSIPLIYGKFDTDQVGINTNVIPTGYTMAVKGKFITEEIKVQQYGTSGWPDFVFGKEYKLPSLTEVEHYINTNGHLQNIPSACEVEENGILLGEMNAKLLQKIEELTLYTIEQQKIIEEQSKAMKVISDRLTALESK